MLYVMEEVERDSGKELESSGSATATDSCSLYTYRICAGWPLVHQWVCMDVINRDLGVNNLLSCSVEHWGWGLG